MYPCTTYTRIPYWFFIIYSWLLFAPSAYANVVIVHLDLAHGKPHITYQGTSYPIAAPKTHFTPACLRLHDITGTVTSIDAHAYWIPTKDTVIDARKKGKRLKTIYRPGERGNALGSRKIMIAWDHRCIPSTVRIHGTNKPHIVRAQRRASRGCIRMLNEHWNQLASRIAPGTPVRITRS